MHPKEPCFKKYKVILGIDFDVAMTEFEQNIVQSQFIETYRSNPAYKTVFEEINYDINFKGYKRTIAGNSPWAWNLSKAGNWAKEALAVTSLEYKDLNHRIAIAQALIYIKHDKTKDDFKNHWKTTNYVCSK